MTVAVAVKVYDGIVLAADSATTLLDPATSKEQVFNNANKIFHLHRELPIGAMTYGLGQVGAASISTLAKDLRQRLMGKESKFGAWKLKPASYTVEGVANRMAEMIFDELDGKSKIAPDRVLGLLVAGYSAGERGAEAWLIDGNQTGVVPVPKLTAGPGDSGWQAYAQPEAIGRLFNGIDPRIDNAIQSALSAAEYKKATDAVFKLGIENMAPQPAMPFADAIAMAEFMVNITVGYARFRIGPDTVGGPVEVAGISRHEGFKWVSRKHYYSADLNPGGLS